MQQDGLNGVCNAVVIQPVSPTTVDTSVLRLCVLPAIEKEAVKALCASRRLLRLSVTFRLYSLEAVYARRYVLSLYVLGGMSCRTSLLTLFAWQYGVCMAVCPQAVLD